MAELHPMKRILVNGASGQLGSELNALSKRIDLPWLQFSFLGRDDWDLAMEESHERILDQQKPDYLIHTAAYTKVDQAEKESDLCRLINVEAPSLIASICNRNNIRMIHFSSDYVFHQRALPIPIKEEDAKSPLGVYAQSKSDAEDQILALDSDALILRTSWVYSSFGHNFVKTMLRLGRQHKSVRVVNDQTGSPTYAADLAQTILDIIIHEASGKGKLSGIYHYSNEGSTTWYELAKEIFSQSGLNETEVLPITTEEFGAAAPRPRYSVLDCSKIKNKINLQIPDWKESLSRCLNEILRDA